MLTDAERLAAASANLARQSTLRSEALRLGDLDAVAVADAEIAETEALIASLTGG